jgi:hypothetical protein
MKTKELLKKALETITELTCSMSAAKDIIIREHGLSHPLNNILSYDVEEICSELESASGGEEATK